MGHIARMGERSGACRVLAGKPEGNRPLGRPIRKWEDNIKIDKITGLKRKKETSIIRRRDFS